MSWIAADLDAGTDRPHLASPNVGGVLRAHGPVWLPLLVLLSMSLVVVALDLDLALAGWFWSDTGGWWLADATWVRWLYRWSNLPALLTGGAGLVVVLVSLRVARLRPFRRPAWFLALALLLGPGLVVNTVFKSHYGRPRPRQVLEFGGTQTFRPLGSPTFDTAACSFPSGHASMGFYWLAPAILCWSTRRNLARALLVLAMVHGGTTGVVRMAQGGHWFSDVLWAAGFIYFTALALHAALAASKAAGHSASSPTGLPRSPDPTTGRARWPASTTSSA